SAVASSELPMTVQWQSTRTTASNGEPVESSWSAVPGATGTTLTVPGTDPNAQHGTFYRAVFSNASGSTNSYPAELRFFSRLDTATVVAVSGESYGPVQPNTPFSVSAPNALVKGQPIVITGTGYLATDGTTGSVANFMVDASYSGDPNTLNTSREIVNPATGQVFSDKRSHGIVQAKADGTWRIEIPWPDESNTDRDSTFFATNWTAGSQHIVRILTGSLLTSPADYQRGISVRFTVVDEPTEPTEPASASIAPSASEVEQGGDLWFTLSGFEPGDAVAVELADGQGEALASAPFVIGADGNTANPDGQTYRKLTAPRDATPGNGYTLRVRDADSGRLLATSDAITVTAATTRVYNPGDHAGGVEDLLVQRGGTWTFHAVGFAANGNLTATATVGGQTVVLSGLGQLANQKAWPLDAHGDTSRTEFTRVQLPTEAVPGELEITFSDGTHQVSRVVTIEAPEQASVTVAATAKLGGTLRVTGQGFLHPNGTEGSTIAIKLNDGAYSRLDGSLHANRTIWWIVEADEAGDFATDMPIPNGTTADTADVPGSIPALVPGDGFTLRFLTGSLKPGDLSRTLQSTPFAVTTDTEPDPELVAATPTIGGSAVVGARLTATAGTWAPAPVALAFQWLADGKAIAGATTTSYPVTAAELGKQLSVRVTGSKAGYRSVTRESARTATIAAAAAPVATVKPSISGTPAVGSTLTAKPGAWSLAGLSFRYQWLRNGAVIGGATKASYKLAAADAGTSLQVRVTASKPGVTAGSATSAAVKAGKALTKTPAPTVSGTFKVGKTLTVKAGTWKPSKVTLKYQWLRDGQPVAKATKTSYKLAKADAGHKVSVRVTGSKTGYVAVAKTSKATAVAKVKATVKLSVPSKVAKGKPATVKLTVAAAVSKPTGTVTVTVNGTKVKASLTTAGKGKMSVTLPAIKKKGSYKVKASFSPSGATASSTSKSSTATATLKVR
ncbi:MAG: Ig-like domain repeat protein, partial [Propionicimonas sp.]|nr:Ig-like domain repeat protein [Propionicimonas sp.]